MEGLCVCVDLGVDIRKPPGTISLTIAQSHSQRKFLGWRKSKPPPLATSDPPTPDSNPNSPIIQLGVPPEKDPARAPPPKQTTTGLGLGLNPAQQTEDGSRLVHFDTDPTIRPQPSFESTQALGCFPSSKSTSPTSPSDSAQPPSAQPKQPQPRAASTSTSITRNSPRPSDSPPAPLLNASVRAGASPYLSSTQSRTTSPLSFSHPHSGALGQSPYGYGSAHPSLARLGERDPDQIHQPVTWSELANPDLVDNVSARERVRQEIL